MGERTRKSALLMHAPVTVVELILVELQKLLSTQELHRDILNHKQAFEELTEIAQTLMGLVGDDEAQVVVESLQEVTDRYAHTVEESERLQELLANARSGLNNFSVNFEDILAWIEEMGSRLSRYQILSVYVEKLQEQFEELNVRSAIGHDYAQC